MKINYRNNSGRLVVNDELRAKGNSALDRIWTRGWLKSAIGDGDLGLIESLDEKVEAQRKASTVVILSEGRIGSLLEGVLSSLKERTSKEIIFACPSFSAGYMARFIRQIEKKDFLLYVVSDGLESLALRTTFYILRSLLIEKGASMASERLVVVAPKNSPMVALGEDEGEFLSFVQDFDIDAAYNSYPIYLGMLLCGLDASEYAQGFKDEVSAPRWDRDGILLGGCMGEYKDVITTCWQEEMDGAVKGAKAFLQVHRHVLMGAKAEELLRRDDRLIIEFTVDTEDYDLSLPTFAGVSKEGSLNIMCKEERAKALEQASCDLIEVELERINEENLGRLGAYLQLSRCIGE